MRDIGIEYLSVFGMPPVEFVNLTADLGCRHIALGLVPMPFNPLNYPGWSLVEDAKLRRETLAAMKDRGVSITLGENFWVLPDVDMRSRERELDITCEMGIRRVNLISSEFDLGRCFDQFAILVEMASKRGLETTVEFVPIMAVPDLKTALAAVRHVGQPSFKVLIDTMHLVRGGSTAKDVAALDPKLIGYVQLCDVPLQFTMEGYAEESVFARFPPGEGGLPLHDIVKALPREHLMGLEIPMLKESIAAGGPKKPLARCVEATRKLLASVDA